MKRLILKLAMLANTLGQNLIEYALMAGFVAVAAGAVDEFSVVGSGATAVHLAHICVNAIKPK